MTILSAIHESLPSRESELREIERQLYLLGWTADRSDEYWVETPDGWSGESYCSDCIDGVFSKELLRWLGSDKAEVRKATSTGSVSDNSLSCAGCGKLLSYTLTNYGAMSELGHFKKVRFKSPLDPRSAYEISTILACISSTDARSAIRVARRAAKAAGEP